MPQSQTQAIATVRRQYRPVAPTSPKPTSPKPTGIVTRILGSGMAAIAG